MNRRGGNSRGQGGAGRSTGARGGAGSGGAARGTGSKAAAPGGRGKNSRPGVGANARADGSTKAGASRSSGRWLARQRKDPFVKDAQAQGWRSRAAFKLLELERRFKLLGRGATVIDLGAAPGGWTQVAVERIGALPGDKGKRGRVVAVDLLAMDAVPGAEVFQGDFLDPTMVPRLLAAAGGPASLVMSDMAPNLSGIRVADQARHLELMEMVLAACPELLQPGGALVVKAFNGAGLEEWLAEVKACFAKVAMVKPDASRSESREAYVVARGYRPAGSV